MPEADMTFKKKADELSTEVSEARGELSRVDEAQRTEAHRDLAATCREAAEWLDGCAEPSEKMSADEAASLTQKAEAFLRDLRMRRNEI